jgi:hypothetical protein
VLSHFGETHSIRFFFLIVGDNTFLVVFPKGGGGVDCMEKNCSNKSVTSADSGPVTRMT